MTRAVALVLILQTMAILFLLNERPSRPVRATYVVRAECLPPVRFKQVPKYRLV